MIQSLSAALRPSGLRAFFPVNRAWCPDRPAPVRPYRVRAALSRRRVLMDRRYRDHTPLPLWRRSFGQASVLAARIRIILSRDAASTRHPSSEPVENDSQRVALTMNGSPFAIAGRFFCGIGGAGVNDRPVTGKFIQKRLYYQLLSWKTFSTPCGGKKYHKLE